MNKSKKTPKITWATFGILWLVFAMNGISREIVNRVSPEIANTYNLSSTQLGTVIAISSLTMAIGSIPLAVWADRGGNGYKRYKRSLALGLGYLLTLFITGALGMFAVGAGFSVFAIVLIIRGFFNAAGESCEVGMMQEWSPRERQGIMVGFQHTGYPWGSFISGLITTALLSAFGADKWGLPFMIFAGVGIIAWLIWRGMCTKERYEKYEADCVANGLTPSLEGLEGGADNTSHAKLGDILKNPNVLIFAFAAFVNDFAYAGISYWLTPYATYIGHVDTAQAASLGVVFTITGGLGQIFWGKVSDKIGVKRIAQLCVIWLAIAFALLKFSYLGIGYLIGFQLLFGFVINAVFILTFQGAAVSAGPGASILSNSVVTCGMYAGGCVATIIVGAMIDRGGGWESVAGYNTSLIFIVVANVISVVLITLFTREVNGKRLGKDFSLVSVEKCNLTHLVENAQKEQRAQQ